MVLTGLKASDARVTEGLHGTLFLITTTAHPRETIGCWWLVPILVRHAT